ncbi:hypothetical protein ACU5EH_10805 [Aliivibrio salmonicida]
MELTKEQIETLLHLVTREMNGFCGDVGYMELSKIKKELELNLDNFKQL